METKLPTVQTPWGEIIIPDISEDERKKVVFMLVNNTIDLNELPLILRVMNRAIMMEHQYHVKINARLTALESRASELDERTKDSVPYGL